MVKVSKVPTDAVRVVKGQKIPSIWFEYAKQMAQGTEYELEKPVEYVSLRTALEWLPKPYSIERYVKDGVSYVKAKPITERTELDRIKKQHDNLRDKDKIKDRTAKATATRARKKAEAKLTSKPSAFGTNAVVQ